MQPVTVCCNTACDLNLSRNLRNLCVKFIRKTVFFYLDDDEKRKISEMLGMNVSEMNVLSYCVFFGIFYQMLLCLVHNWK